MIPSGQREGSERFIIFDWSGFEVDRFNDEREVDEDEVSMIDELLSDGEEFSCPREEAKILGVLLLTLFSGFDLPDNENDLCLFLWVLCWNKNERLFSVVELDVGDASDGLYANGEVGNPLFILLFILFVVLIVGMTASLTVDVGVSMVLLLIIGVAKGLDLIFCESPVFDLIFDVFSILSIELFVIFELLF